MHSGRGRWLCGPGEAACRWVGSRWGILTQAICCGGCGSSRRNDHLLGRNDIVYTLTIGGYGMHDD